MMSAVNEPAKKPAKNTKLKESLLKTIESGKSDANDVAENEAVSPFDEAGKIEPVMPAEVTAEVNEALDKAANQSKEQPEPQKVASRKKAKSSRGSMSAIALAFSLVAMAGAGYSVWHQQGYGQEVSSSLVSVDEAIGSLTSRTDEIYAGLSDAEKTIALTTDRLAKVESQAALSQTNKSSIDGMAGALKELTGRTDEHQNTLTKYGQEYADLKQKFSSLSKRTKSTKKVVRKVAPVVKDDPTNIEGATLSSLDMWGTRRSAVLRDANGQWVPLTQGDFYKGWRFTGIHGQEALFKKGSKTRRLTVKE